MPPIPPEVKCPPEVKVYVEQLYKLGHGYPLYDPDPLHSPPVSIGDVGYVSRSGRFFRLFNVLNPEDDPVPQGFVPMRSEDLQPHTKYYMPQHLYSSSSVHSSGLAVEVQLADVGFVDNSISFIKD